MTKLLIIFFVFLSFALVVILNKYRNTRTAFYIRFAWFLIGMGIFFIFFSPFYTLTQNIVMAVIAVLGLIYFAYNILHSQKDKEE